MHKLEEIYWEEQLIDDIELNLFEPECIITDNPKDEFPIFALEDRSVETSIRGICIEANNTCNFSVPTNLKDSLTIRPVTKPMVSSYNDSVYSNGSVFSSASTLSNMYLDEVEMHSIFTPDKQTKPKEIFTQCHVCGKYVIVRMCPETGVYSKCRYCFNSPFSNTDDVIFENLNVLPDGIEPEVTITTMDLNVQNVIPVAPPPAANGSHSKSDGSFKCEHCGKLFTRNWYLKQHIKLHSNDKPYSCDMCDKRFLNSSNLKQHMKTHSVEYRCHVCNRTYISQSLLTEHLLKHTDVDVAKVPENSHTPRFQCSYCSQGFEDDVRFKEHLKSHTKELPYHCDKCDKAFRYNNSLTKHKKVHDFESEEALNLSKPKS